MHIKNPVAQTVLQYDVLLAGWRESHAGAHQKVCRFVRIEFQCRRQSQNGFFLRYVGIAAADFGKQLPVKVRGFVNRHIIHASLIYEAKESLVKALPCVGNQFLQGQRLRHRL